VRASNSAKTATFDKRKRLPSFYIFGHMQLRASLKKYVCELTGIGSVYRTCVDVYSGGIGFIHGGLRDEVAALRRSGDGRHADAS
jgi:hypothetical protein